MMDKILTNAMNTCQQIFMLYDNQQRHQLDGVNVKLLAPITG